MWSKVKNIPNGAELPLKSGNKSITIIAREDENRVWYRIANAAKRSCHRDTIVALEKFIDNGGSIPGPSKMPLDIIKAEDHYNSSYIFAILNYLGVAGEIKLPDEWRIHIKHNSTGEFFLVSPANQSLLLGSREEARRAWECLQTFLVNGKTHGIQPEYATVPGISITEAAAMAMNIAPHVFQKESQTKNRIRRHVQRNSADLGARQTLTGQWRLEPIKVSAWINNIVQMSA